MFDHAYYQKTAHFYYRVERNSIVKALGAAAVQRPLDHIALRSKQFRLMENCILPERLNILRLFPYSFLYARKTFSIQFLTIKSPTQLLSEAMHTHTCFPGTRGTDVRT